MNLTEAIEEFLLDQRMKGNSKLTREYYIRSLKLFLAFMGNMDVRQISLLDCKKYVVSLQDDTRKNTVSVQSYVRALRAFLTWLYNNEYTEMNIPAKLKLPKAQNTVKDVLTAAEVDRLFSSFNENTFTGLRDLCMISFMLGSGLRRAEVITMKADSLHIDAGYALVTGKGNKQRNVPIGEYAAKKLRLYMSVRPEAEYLFTLADGKPLSDVTVKDLFRKLKRRTGIKRLHPHLLRHTFATMYLTNGGNIYTLQTILGHTSLEMVKKYLHIAPGYVIANFGKYSPIDVKNGHHDS